MEVKSELWRTTISPEIKSQIKTNLLSTLNSPEKDARHISAMTIAKVAGIEFPVGQWPDLCSILVSGISTGSVGVKLAGLETLGYVCEEVEESLLKQKEINMILGKVVEHMSVDIDVSILEAATSAMFNMLTFVSSNFQIENERNVVMQALCTVATKASTVKARKTAYECLAKIVSLYYNTLPNYMQVLFSITLNAIKTDDQMVALQALEFWSSICDEENDLQEREEELREQGEEVPPDQKCNGYIIAGKSYLVPLLLECMCKQEEDQDETSWNLAAAGAVCMGLVANVIKDEILGLVMPFVNESVNSTDWRKRDAAVLVFGNILKGPSTEKLLPLIMQAFPHFLTVLKEEKVVMVRESVAWSISSIISEFMEHIAFEHWGVIIDQLVERLGDEPLIARKITACLNIIATSLETNANLDPSAPSNVLSPKFNHVLTKLYECAGRSDWNENDLRTSCYDAMNAWVSNSAPDQAGLLISFLQNLMSVLEHSLNAHITSEDMRNEHSKLQSCICTSLQALTRR
jgi:importin subunit beta-1